MSKQPTKSNKKTLKWAAIIFVTLIIFAGFRYFTAQRAMSERRAIMEEQRQVLIDSWQSQGLSDAEIKAKLVEQGPANFTNDRPASFGIMRIITGGHRSGTGRSK